MPRASRSAPNAKPSRRALPMILSASLHLVGLIAKGVEVLYVSEDAEDRGLVPASRIDGPRPVARAELTTLFDSHDNVWHW